MSGASDRNTLSGSFILFCHCLNTCLLVQGDTLSAQQTGGVCVLWSVGMIPVLRPIRTVRPEMPLQIPESSSEFGYLLQIDILKG